ncbi:acyl-CoA dehydrogenase [Rhodoplanes elegans]|uniref:3-methylmercaptopropionyl-CoA dehydrogenase n=1 Tax=Rhodoplanes elegans TaxID=29408 RepID=A0A327JYP4_9BRAD|nr:acyl-CoA dehydrogenase family protein [Rhodoplanes elegans]MBK5960449.1 acyl-CoA dehydrogenase [Rhodoplanes elegans]RAI31297.1 acyl-CoA dehydrogenase [Rhodoplanes elegans]
MDYIAPVKAIHLALDDVAGLADDLAAGLHGDLDHEMPAHILEEAGRFAGETLAPVDREGDRVGARFANGTVTLPDGWPAIYKAWAEAGWNTVDLPPEWGGMGLPVRLATACMEMWTSACMSFSLGPVLTQGAVDALELHADRALKEKYLPKLVAGEWTATMALTEPQAGSDLAAVRTRAVKAEDGTYRLSGQKIFITYAEHDLAENIVHLVLARLADAPPGTKGLSLFLVPKFLVGDDGTLGARNDVWCTGIEDKLGIHASPTCSLAFGDHGGAVGWLVGAENRGLACMFTMMNKARLFTGVQGVAVAERAYQRALAYAKTRRQGRAAGAPPDQSSLIVAHADVRRTLMTMKAMTAAARAIAYAAAAAIDRARHARTADEREAAERLAGLLTPVTKACCSDTGVEVASLGIQIHGGMGFVEDTGAAQQYRDARIVPIYEGTNGIQAIDLVTRKILGPGGAITEATIAVYREVGTAAGAIAEPRLRLLGGIVGEAADALAQATAWLRAPERTPEELLAVATPYLRLFGLAAGVAYLAKAALAARARREAGDNDPIHADTIATAYFYAQAIAVGAPALARVVIASADALPGPESLSDFAA